MRKGLKLLLSLLLLLPLTSCSKKNTLSYEELRNKLDGGETFTFVITKDNCSGCSDYKPIIKEYNKTADELVYTIRWDDIEPTDQVILAASTFELFGINYYNEYEATSTQVITPTTIHVVNGEFDHGATRTLQLQELDNLIHSNIVNLYDFYGFNRKTANNDSFTIAFYSAVEQHQKYVNEANITNNKLYTLDISNLSTSDSTRLLNRVNYYLGETFALDTLESHFQLTYSEGVIISYTTIS